MKLILATLNSRYTHMSLSLRYLRAMIEERFPDQLHADDDTTGSRGSLEVQMMEFSINQPHELILRELFETAPSVLCFSVYIWNVAQILKLAASLKKILPEVRILFGGPEVSYEAVNYLNQYKFLDAVITGEGEAAFTAYVKRALEVHAGHNVTAEPDSTTQARAAAAIPGLVERRGLMVTDHGRGALIENLDEIPFPYKQEDFEAGRMLYYEASRGCPYRCAYCLSSLEPGVRWFSLERVKRDLLKLLEARVMQVKFVDRTFNVDAKRTRDLFQFLMDHDNGTTRFHFEMTASLLSHEDYDVLRNARPGLFQFEIGVQSTYEAAMAAVQRIMPFQNTAEACRALLRLGNIHLHLDLIAGLPFETFERFMHSFDDVFSLRPHALQLGFLKLIPGSPLSAEAERYGYVYESHPPYEVLGHEQIHFSELARLKRVEALVELYYNSHGYMLTLEMAIQRSGMKPSAFFLDLADFFEARSFDRMPHRSETHYTHFETYLKTKAWYHPDFEWMLDYDCMATLAKVRREPVESPSVRALIHDALRAAHPELPVKMLLKKIRYQTFGEDVLSWISGERQPMTGARELNPSAESNEGAANPLWLGWVELSHRSPITERYTYSQLPLR